MMLFYLSCLRVICFGKRGAWSDDGLGAAALQVYVPMTMCGSQSGTSCVQMLYLLCSSGGAAHMVLLS